MIFDIGNIFPEILLLLEILVHLLLIYYHAFALLLSDYHTRLIHILLKRYTDLELLLADSQTLIIRFQSELFGKHLSHHPLFLDLLPQ